MIIRDYYEQQHTNKVDHLEGMDKLLQRYKLPRLKQEEIENIIRPITSTVIESVITKLPTNKSLRSDDFTGECYQKFREELTPILLKLFQKTAEEGTFLNSFHKASNTLLSKPG